MVWINLPTSIALILTLNRVFSRDQRYFVVAYVKTTAAAMAIITVLTGCATPPLEPRVALTPASKKSPEAFEEDQGSASSTRINKLRTINKKTRPWRLASSWSVSYSSLALAGPGPASEEERTRKDAQWRYDLAYQQCMYVEGNEVAGFEPAMLLATP